MRRVLPLLLVLPMVAGCSTGKVAPTTAGSEPKPTADAAEATRQQADVFAALAGGGSQSEVKPDPRLEASYVVDKETGKKLERIPKTRSLFVKDGLLFNAQVMGGGIGTPIVREDADAYYVEAIEPKAAPVTRPGPQSRPSETARAREFPESEAEVVTPPRSSRKVRFEEISAGLPKTGFWRTNMAVADLDGDGGPEILTPPPRLTMSPPRIFKWGGQGWQEVKMSIGGTEPPRLGYGGVALGDMNGDGKLDVVSIGHIAGVAVLINDGFPRFRVETRGLPGSMSGRAVAVGDINGDGRLDIVAQSDEPPKAADDKAGKVPTQEPDREVRAFLARADGSYEEVAGGPELPCFGYAVALVAAPSDGQEPFLYDSCRYGGGTHVLYTFDKSSSKFQVVGKTMVEQNAYHIGGAGLTYAGKPAVAATYIKSAPEEAKPQFSGHGVSIYYRDGTEWKSRRVVKVLAAPPAETQGIGTGDVDGDGLDDIVWADDGKGRLRVFFQTREGGFEELPEEEQPSLVNKTMSVRVSDVDRDGKNDVVLMFEYASSSKSRNGGLRFFRNLR